MKIVIDLDECDKLGITFDEIFYLLSIYSNTPIEAKTFRHIDSLGLVDYQILRDGFPVSCGMTQKGVDVVESVILNSEYTEKAEDSNGKIRDRFDILADKLRELFPKGRKEGTNLQWRDSTAIISKRLKTIVKKYNIG